MADGYWSRQHQPPPPSFLGPGGTLKRPRNEYDLPPAMPSANELLGFMPLEDDRGVSRSVKDTKSIDSAYDRYLQSAKMSSGEASSFGGLGPGRSGHPPMSDPVMGHPGFGGPDAAPSGQPRGFGGQPPIDSRQSREGLLPLPPDASNTLYVEGLPSDCTRREVAHIFRPFVGYREVRLVTKDVKHRSGDPLLLCFVDFKNPACAATAMSALQGYKVDESEPDSKFLRLQFSRNPGPRSASGPRGKR